MYQGKFCLTLFTGIFIYLFNLLQFKVNTFSIKAVTATENVFRRVEAMLRPQRFAQTIFFFFFFFKVSPFFVASQLFGSVKPSFFNFNESRVWKEGSRSNPVHHHLSFSIPPIVSFKWTKLHLKAKWSFCQTSR